jgi:CheY-like chemotaxis protein
MRPPKVVLCVASSEQKLSIQRFVLDTWGYRVQGATSASDALRILQREEPGTIDLLILNLPLAAHHKLIEAAIEAQPEIRTVAISATPDCDHTCKVDVFLPEGNNFSAELHERMRILVTRRRGPKKKPMDSIAPQRQEAHYG